jgi:uncharacterized protein
MRDKLRRRYQVQKEVARNGYFEGEIPLSELTRLDDLLDHQNRSENGDKVAVQFEFLRNELGVAMLAGELQASLPLECQRCLESLRLPLQQPIELLIDADEQLAGETGADTISSEDGYIDIYSVIEDELILAIPLVALHEDTDCNKHWPAAAGAESETGQSPFAVLQQLKTTD